MMVAAIDVGTNSTRLLICSVTPIFNKEPLIIPQVREMCITRLGKNISFSGEISKTSADKTIKVLNNYLKIINDYNVQRFKAVGTKVLRSAKNSLWFINKVFNELQINIEVISEIQEASLSFIGAVKNLNKNFLDKLGETKNVLVIDIGGGSTEFVIGNLNGEVFYVNSIPIGSVTVSELFLNEEKPNTDKLLEMSQYIERNLRTVINEVKEFNFSCILGLAGTISTLAAVDLKLKKYDRERLNGYILFYEKIIEIQNLFCSTNLEKRRKIAGLEKERADIIIGGTQIVIKILELLNEKKIFVSENDILDGIIYSII